MPSVASGPRTMTAPERISTTSTPSAADHSASNSVPVTAIENGPASTDQRASGRCTTRKCARPCSSATRAPWASTSTMRARAPVFTRTSVPSVKCATAGLPFVPCRYPPSFGDAPAISYASGRGVPRYTTSAATATSAAAANAAQRATRPRGFSIASAAFSCRFPAADAPGFVASEKAARASSPMRSSTSSRSSGGIAGFMLHLARGEERGQDKRG
ncbi:MAG TPA: hypothetical protein VHB21_12040, partial [Minicystis sp.]|nr:hypothetical protein [Minicystis sp.]